MVKTKQDTQKPVRRSLWILGCICLLLAGGAFAFLYQPAYAPTAETRNQVEGAIARQQAIDAQLQAYYRAGEYTFQDPLVVQDPYQLAPLTALVIFDTPEECRVSLHVAGRLPQAEVDFSFPGYRQHHEIPVYGLYADATNRVMLTVIGRDEASEQTELVLQTEPLPVGFPEIQAQVLDPAGYSPGFNLSFWDQKPIFDLQGQVRWFSSQPSFSVFAPLKNGHYLFVYGKDDNVMMEQDLLGRIYAVYDVPDGIHHDVIELPTGNLLVTSQDLSSSTVEDLLLELDRRTGRVVRTVDLKRVLDASRPAVIGMPAGDWLHLNSIVYDEADDSLILSSKAQSAVVKLTYPGLQIRWILGAHDNWDEPYQPYLLTPVGEDFNWSWSQHHATLYEKNNPLDAWIDILLFDNGMHRSFDLSTAASPPEWFSRVVHYRINEAEMTVEQVWDFGRENGLGVFSMHQSGAYRLPNGNVLGTWAAVAWDPQGNPVTKITDQDSYETRVYEVDPASGEVVFTSVMPGITTYRTLRTDFYAGYSTQDGLLDSGIDDTTGRDLADRLRLAWRDIRSWTDTVPLLLWLKRLVRLVL